MVIFNSYVSLPEGIHYLPLAEFIIFSTCPTSSAEADDRKTLRFAKMLEEHHGLFLVVKIGYSPEISIEK